MSVDLQGLLRALGERERTVFAHVLRRSTTARDPNAAFEARLTFGERVADPYPFILLNLALSCLAALQAPVIMMSQNRQAAKDRLDAQHDYRST
jgi:uncharacterized membrane protein